MHNNDLITGGVGIVSGRLDAKHTFIICNLSFREEKETMVRADWAAATEKPDTVRNWNQSESFQAWTHIQPYVASVLSAHGQLRGVWKVIFSKTCSPSAYKTCHLLSFDKASCQKEKEKWPLFNRDQALDVFSFNLRVSIDSLFKVSVCCQGFSVRFIC